MSVLRFSRVHGPFPSTAGRLDGLNPRRWALWSLSRPVLVYLALAEIAAVAVVCATLGLVPINDKMKKVVQKLRMGGSGGELRTIQSCQALPLSLAHQWLRDFSTESGPRIGYRYM